MDTIPLIDVAPLLSGDPDGLAAVAAEIGQACRGTGFFAVTGHRIDATRTEAVFTASKAFFGADDAIKEAVSIQRSPHNRGYVGMKVEALDPSRPPDLKEAFNVGLELSPDDPEILASRPFRGVNLWPALPGFRETVLAYYDAVWALGRSLHRAVAVDLGLDQHFFEDKLDRPLATLRLLHYPPRPTSLMPGELGAGEHTDYGNLTLLLTDAVGGLEVRRRDGSWLAVPFTPGALICNIGDCLMRWTNDVYASTPHRVVSPPGSERFSVAFFLDANPDAVVDCLPTCRGDGEHYPRITAADYLRGRLDATYAHRRV
jgi:isopenicillin N synthase-like dioxygenase